MTIQQTHTHIPPALRAAKPKHEATRSVATKRLAGGAVLSAAIASGAFVIAPLAGLSSIGAAGIAQAAPCADGDIACVLTEGGSELFGGGDGSLFGAGVAATADAFAPFNAIGPGGWLIGNGADAKAGCVGDDCNGGDGGLLFGNGGKGADGGRGGNAGLHR